ncbi:hypothetical protein ACFV5J_36200 [Streptomyces zaomyceticus]|uniref:DUF7677 family protein n=1 Tax=Streptomyces zaomyceticus TaxID=68286 RepID=UPI00364E02B7
MGTENYGTIDVELLDGFDYRSTVFHSGSSLEQVFAIYGNVLQVDADGMVLNDGDAQSGSRSGSGRAATRAIGSSRRSRPGRPNSIFEDRAVVAWPRQPPEGIGEAPRPDERANAVGHVPSRMAAPDTVWL